MESYAKLPDSIKKKIEWEVISERIRYKSKTDTRDLTIGTLRTVQHHLPDMKVSMGKNSGFFGATLNVPGKGLGNISFNGLSVSEVIDLLDSKPRIVEEILTPKFDDTRHRVVLEDNKQDDGARVTVAKDYYGLLSRYRPYVELTVWPQDEEHRKFLRELASNVKHNTYDWEN